MLTLHNDIELTCGDEWQIVGQLLQEDGSPLDLQPAVQLGWVLLDPDGMSIPGLGDLTTLERVEPVTDGKVLISISDTLTRTFRPGRYTNAIRVWVGEAPATLWRGLVLANADPFFAAVPA